MLPIARICPERSWGIHISNVDARTFISLLQQRRADLMLHRGFRKAMTASLVPVAWKTPVVVLPDGNHVLAFEAFGLHHVRARGVAGNLWRCRMPGLLAGLRSDQRIVLGLGIVRRRPLRGDQLTSLAASPVE